MMSFAEKSKEKKFKYFVLITLTTVYLLILIGGIVRTTGSGMGCPDWPKCYGMWVPPTHISQLPPDYKDRYRHLGHVADFNVTHTWIEYINRLFGVLTGIFILITFVLSLQYKQDKNIKYYCAAVLVLVILEGIIGKYVVSTNLKPLIISIHMWMAIAIILLLVYVWCKLEQKVLLTSESQNNISKMLPLLVTLFILTVIQSLLGSNVRQHIDTISQKLNMQFRETWLDNVGSIYIVHRSFAWIVLLLHIYVAYKILSSQKFEPLRKAVYILLAILVIELLLGLIMAWFSMPAFAQPIHMLMATLLLSAQFYIINVLWFNKKIKLVQV
ncbi:MAG: COX15/CtaA family protein [Cytophagaceae bacterium]|nr:COX15/CtaA family protein [Cytophagaceae bacterium]MDW8455623.1 COX15/CtaA family protein [Cytophagaceae bacterium]